MMKCGRKSVRVVDDRNVSICELFHYAILRLPLLRLIGLEGYIIDCTPRHVAYRLRDVLLKVEVGLWWRKATSMSFTGVASNSSLIVPINSYDCTRIAPIFPLAPDMQLSNEEPLVLCHGGVLSTSEASCIQCTLGNTCLQRGMSPLAKLDKT